MLIGRLAGDEVDEGDWHPVPGTVASSYTR